MVAGDQRDKVKKDGELMRLSDKTAVVVDASYFFPVAQRLARDFKKVYYFKPRSSNYATIQEARIGYGYENIVPLDEDDFYKLVYNGVDLMVYPDVNSGGEQWFFRKLGRDVCGSGMSEIYENDRVKFKEAITKLGLPVVHYDGPITDIDDLEKILKSTEDKYVKISYWRGEGESFHHENWKKSEKWFHDLATRLYPFSHKFEEIIVEDPIKAKVECGTDRWISNKKFLEYGLQGIEIKNEVYIAKATHESDIPELLRDIDNKVLPLYNKYDLRGPISTEIRVPKKGVGYFLEPTPRQGFPPVHSAVTMYGNFSKMCNACARNESIVPEMDYKHVVEIIFNSSEAGTEAIPVSYPKEYADNVWLKSPVFLDGQHYVISIDKGNVLGGVSVGDDSLEDAIAKCKEIVSQICAPGIFYKAEAFDAALKQLAEAKKLGVGF